MLAAFLGGWEIVILLVMAGGIGVVFLATLVVVLLVNLRELRAKNNPPAGAAPSAPQGGQ
jgi:hypothetical protein